MYILSPELSHKFFGRAIDQIQKRIRIKADRQPYAIKLPSRLTPRPSILSLKPGRSSSIPVVLRVVSNVVGHGCWRSRRWPNQASSQQQRAKRTRFLQSAVYSRPLGQQNVCVQWIFYIVGLFSSVPHWIASSPPRSAPRETRIAPPWIWIIWTSLSRSVATSTATQNQHTTRYYYQLFANARFTFFFLHRIIIFHNLFKCALIICMH